jgi:hypothetical protein
MMNQETYVKVHDLRRQGWTIGEIAAETGFHPETISIYLKSEEPPTRRRVPDTALVMNARWRQRVTTLRIGGLSEFRCNRVWVGHWLVGNSRSSNMMAKALSAGFQRTAHRCLPRPVGSRDLITRCRHLIAACSLGK